MTKIRAPFSFDQAVTRIAGLIDWPEIRRITRRSLRTVRYWGEPDCKMTPSLAQAFALDMAYLAAGGTEAPILSAYAAMVGFAHSDMMACRVQAAEDLAIMSREFSDLIASGIKLIQPGSTITDAHRALAEAEEATTWLKRWSSRVTSFLPAGAGPVVGKVRGAS